MDIFKDDAKYLLGFKNWCIRYYYYLNAGLNELNNFRNLFLGIFAIYIALKLTNILWMVGMFVPSVVVLTVIGYYTVHRISKVRDWLGTRFSSYFGMKSINYTEESFKLLQSINEQLVTLNKEVDTLK